MKNRAPAIITILVLPLALAACAGDQSHPHGPRIRAHSDPGLVVDAEIAFARLAQDKGQWTAFRTTAAPEAEMFVPRRVLAQVWLKGRTDPPKAVAWQPHQAWSSCDGSIAVTHGGWQRPDGSVGYFTTVWARTLAGDYKWVLDHGDTLAMPLPAPEMIAAHTATCGGPRPGVPVVAPEVGADMKQIVAKDQTLQVTSTVSPDAGRRVTVRVWDGKAFATVLDESVAAPH